MQILIRELLEEFLRNFFGEEIGGGQGNSDPLIEKLRMNKKTYGLIGE